MPTIENRSNELVIVAKNSGPSLYLAPGEAADVPRAEIDGNQKIEKLVRIGALSIGERASHAKSESEPRLKREKSSPRR